MRIAIIVDIHEDIESLKKALGMIDKERCDHIVCLGDILGYPYLRARYEHKRDAAECIRLVKNNCLVVLQGNHDVFHIKKIPEYTSGIELDHRHFEMEKEELKAFSMNKIWNYADDSAVNLSDKDKEYMYSLPEYVVRDFDQVRLLLSHFLYPSFTGYVSTGHNNGKNMEDHFTFMKNNDCLLSITGHQHIEGIGLSYEPDNNLISKVFRGFSYYSYGERKLKQKACTATVPALADNGQVNGFSVFDTKTYSITAISLNTNRRFIL